MDQTTMPAFRMEVDGTWIDRMGLERTLHTDVFLVAAPGPEAAEVAAVQLFAAAAARQGRRVDGERWVRALDG